MKHVLKRLFNRDDVANLLITSSYYFTLVFACGYAYADSPRLHVSDGDTLVIAGERIRLWGMDAPELGQKCQKLNVAYDCGITAREVLISLIGDQFVVCGQVDIDRYGRTVARCSVNGEDLGEQMVEAGWALDFARYSDGFYAVAERQAREGRRGLWAGQFDPPWEWRHPSRSAN